MALRVEARAVLAAELPWAAGQVALAAERWQEEVEVRAGALEQAAEAEAEAPQTGEPPATSPSSSRMAPAPP